MVGSMFTCQGSGSFLLTKNKTIGYTRGSIRMQRDAISPFLGQLSSRGIILIIGAE